MTPTIAAITPTAIVTTGGRMAILASSVRHQDDAVEHEAIGEQVDRQVVEVPDAGIDLGVDRLEADLAAAGLDEVIDRHRAGVRLANQRVHDVVAGTRPVLEVGHGRPVLAVSYTHLTLPTSDLV